MLEPQWTRHLLRLALRALPRSAIYEMNSSVLPERRKMSFGKEFVFHFARR